MPTIKIHDAETNEIIERDMTVIELEQMEQDKALIEIRAEIQQKRTTAEEKLKALGLTTDDLKALGLG
jgi:hypothetical protein